MYDIISYENGVKDRFSRAALILVYESNESLKAAPSLSNATAATPI